MQDDPDAYEVIEFPMKGETYGHPRYGVYRYSTYEESSVLAGQQKRQYLDDFDNLPEARKNYPNAEWSEDAGSGFIQHTVPRLPPTDFDPTIAGERWDEDD